MQKTTKQIFDDAGRPLKDWTSKQIFDDAGRPLKDLTSLETPNNTESVSAQLRFKSLGRTFPYSMHDAMAAAMADGKINIESIEKGKKQ